MSQQEITQSELTQAEAFCVMECQCEKCKKVELLWNSRDGVTPFIISSGCCEGERANHINFKNDAFNPSLPKYIPINRVFVSHTKESALASATARFERIGQDMMDKYPHLKEIGKDGLIEESSKDIYGDGNQPRVISREEYESTLKR